MSLPHWARAHGPVLFPAIIRAKPEDFNVSEELGFDFDGDGEHDYLYLRKTGTNTEWLARQLAHFAGVAARDVGYSGLKDRNAVTRQWFSIPRWNGPDWSLLDIDGVELEQQARHSRKLRRGAHRLNHFAIILRTGQFSGDALAERMQTISSLGVPNYFGEQRFGRNSANLQLADAWALGRRLPRHKRSIAISSARSFLFNQCLHERVVDGSWNRIVAGDTANLDGSGSVFEVTTVDSDIERRCREMDIHPAGLLAGAGSECANKAWQEAFDHAKVKPGTRSFRLPVVDLRAETGDDFIELRFSLQRGSFATSVLREIADYQN